MKSSTLLQCQPGSEPLLPLFLLTEKSLQGLIHTNGFYDLLHRHLFIPIFDLAQSHIQFWIGSELKSAVSIAVEGRRRSHTEKLDVDEINADFLHQKRQVYGTRIKFADMIASSMSELALSIPLDWATIARTTPYAPAAFAFVQDGLGYTSELFQNREFDSHGFDEFDLHVSGQQLCMGLRDFAIQQYGLLAPVVLKQWGVKRTEDFGAIVFRMVELELLRTSPQDSEDDFRAIYQFDEVFHASELSDCIGSNR